MEVFVVTEFGCNSGCNDMYPPNVHVFGSKEKAMECYLKLKNEIIKMNENCNIHYDLYERETYECIIQKGGENHGGPDGAKRPIGVMISHKALQEMKPTFRGAW